MLIGLDFDNTIVRYDGVFHAVAAEKGLIDSNVGVSKLAVRDALRARGMEEEWIELQGYVYGRRMDDATMFDGVLEFLRWAVAAGHECVIISHRTRHPYRGPAYDLHASAAAWVQRYLVAEGKPLLSPYQISFHETKSEKIAQIGHLKCDVFLDDLPEILGASEFPAATKGILFDPGNSHADVTGGVARVSAWTELPQAIREEASAVP